MRQALTRLRLSFFVKAEKYLYCLMWIMPEQEGDIRPAYHQIDAFCRW